MKERKAKQLSVMASGMGMPSMGIYSYELYKFYDVENIIRIGSAGAYTKKLKVMDVVLADAAWSESAYGYAQCLDDSAWKFPSKEFSFLHLSDTDFRFCKTQNFVSFTFRIIVSIMVTVQNRTNHLLMRP